MLTLHDINLPEDLTLKLAELELQYNNNHPDDPMTVQDIAETLLMVAITRFGVEDLER